jgi:hypothetical protein
MRSPTAVQRAIDVLGYRCCRLECADMLQESSYNGEAPLVTVWMVLVITLIANRATFDHFTCEWSYHAICE